DVSRSRVCLSGRQSAPPARGGVLAAELAKQWRSVERLIPEPRGDLLTRRPRPLLAQRAQCVTGGGVAPPVFADLADEVVAELRGADPRPQVIGRVEAAVHVGKASVCAVEHGC